MKLMNKTSITSQWLPDQIASFCVGGVLYVGARGYHRSLLCPSFSTLSLQSSTARKVSLPFTTNGSILMTSSSVEAMDLNMDSAPYFQHKKRSQTSTQLSATIWTTDNLTPPWEVNGISMHYVKLPIISKKYVENKIPKVTRNQLHITEQSRKNSCLFMSWFCVLEPFVFILIMCPS